MKSVITIFSFILLLSIGCKTPITEIPEAPIVVKGYLEAGEKISNFYVENVANSREFESELNVPIENAEISIFAGEEEIILVQNPDHPGYYYNDTHMVLPGTTYDLRLKHDSKTVTASCFVPDTLIIETGFGLADSIKLGGTENPEEVISFSWESQSGFEYLMELSVDDDAMPLTFSDNIGKFDQVYANPFKEGSASLFDDYFAFSGKHTITIYTITSEYADYFRYLPQALDRNIYSAPNNIQGGYGVFAGRTGTTIEFTLYE